MASDRFLLEDDMNPEYYEPRQDPELIEPVANLLYAAVQAGAVKSATTFVGRTYSRKGRAEVTEVGNPPNPHYATETDDYFVHLAVRIPYWDVANHVQDEIGEVTGIAARGKLAEAEHRAEAAAERASAAQSEHEAALEEVRRIRGSA